MEIMEIHLVFIVSNNYITIVTMFLTLSDQEIMVQILIIGRMTRKSQSIFSSKESFYKSMTKLKRSGLIRSEKHSRFRTYFLTDKGWAQAMIIVKGTEYNKFFRDFYVFK